MWMGRRAKFDTEHVRNVTQCVVAPLDAIGDISGTQKRVLPNTLESRPCKQLLMINPTSALISGNSVILGVVRMVSG